MYRIYRYSQVTLIHCNGYQMFYSNGKHHHKGCGKLKALIYCAIRTFSSFTGVTIAMDTNANGDS